MLGFIDPVTPHERLNLHKLLRTDYLDLALYNLRYLTPNFYRGFLLLLRWPGKNIFCLFL